MLACSRISATFVPADRNVRRRFSESPSVSRNQSDPDSPTRAALREEVAKRDEAVDHLRGQLQDVKDRTAMELTSQRNNFIAAAQQHEIASREVNANATAELNAKISELNLEKRRTQALQEEMLRLQSEAAEAKALARQASNDERLSREQAPAHDSDVHHY